MRWVAVLRGAGGLQASDAPPLAGRPDPVLHPGATDPRRRWSRALTGGLSLAGLVGVLDRAHVVVCNDTGPLRRTRHRPMISWTMHCPRCGVDCTRDLSAAPRRGTACLHPVSFVDDVPVAEVVAALDALLSTVPASA